MTIRYGARPAGEQAARPSGERGASVIDLAALAARPPEADGFSHLDEGRDLAAEVAVDDDAAVSRLVALAREPLAELPADDDGSDPFGDDA